MSHPDIWMGQNALHQLIRRRQRGQRLPIVWRGRAQEPGSKSQGPEERPDKQCPWFSENSISSCPLKEAPVRLKDAWVFWQTWKFMARERYHSQPWAKVFSPNGPGSCCLRRGTTEQRAPETQQQAVPIRWYNPLGAETHLSKQTNIKVLWERFQLP